MRKNESRILNFKKKTYHYVSVWWDTTHAFGYYIALLPQIGGAVTYMTSITIMITFFASICTYIEACVDDLSTIICQTNEIATEYTANDCNKMQIGLRLRYCIIDTIQLHIDILRYYFGVYRKSCNLLLITFVCVCVCFLLFPFSSRIMDTFRKIMSGPLFYQLFVYVVFLALNLLQFDNVSNGNNTTFGCCVQ